MNELYQLMIQAEDVLRQAKFVAIREPLARVEVDEQRTDEHLRMAQAELVMAINQLEMAAAQRYDDACDGETCANAQAGGEPEDSRPQADSMAGYNSTFCRENSRSAEPAVARRRPGRPRKVRQDEPGAQGHPQVPDVLPSPLELEPPIPLADAPAPIDSPPAPAVEPPQPSMQSDRDDLECLEDLSF